VPRLIAAGRQSRNDYAANPHSDSVLVAAE
jgi:hypothetical protein